MSHRRTQLIIDVPDSRLIELLSVGQAITPSKLEYSTMHAVYLCVNFGGFRHKHVMPIDKYLPGTFKAVATEKLKDLLFDIGLHIDSDEPRKFEYLDELIELLQFGNICFQHTNVPQVWKLHENCEIYVEEISVVGVDRKYFCVGSGEGLFNAL
jgi:hypothetical protein